MSLAHCTSHAPAAFGSSSCSRRGSTCSSSRANVARVSRVSVSAAASRQEHATGGAGLESPSVVARRQMLALGAVVPLLLQQQARADDEAPAPPPAEYATFLGMASPPTSYGGYGGNANERPKYSFEYPQGWKSEVPSKVEKGTQGIDGRVVNPRGKDQRAFVITLTRAGEDDKSFKLTDIDSTFAGFQGADYDLQDAMTSATNITKSEAERGGVKFFDYDIESPTYRYLSSIAVKDGKVFALFVRSPTKAFGGVEGKLRHIVDTFKLL